MSGAGKWIKKHPLQIVGLLAGAAVGGPALIGLLSPAAAPVAASGALLGDAELALAGSQVAGAAGRDALISAAPLTKMAYDVPQFAALDAGAFNPTTTGPFDKLGVFADKMWPYAKAANMGMGLLDQSQPQAPQIAPPQLRGSSGQTFNPAPLYGSAPADPEEERRRMMLAMLMGQQSGVA